MGRLCDGGYEKEDKYMKKDWENVTLMPEFDEQGVLPAIGWMAEII